MSNEVIVAIITGLATVAAAVIGVIRMQKRSSESDALSSSKEARQKRTHRFDVFVSAPLASLATDEDISIEHDRTASVVALLENQFGFAVYWAGRNIRKRADFEAADLSAKSDVAAILDSKYFLLLYPDKLASSVLFEAGIALRACLTSLYFVRDRTHLPFLMTQASQAFANVRIYEGKLPDDLCGLLQRHGKSFFDPHRTN
jgi:hypothetical protein